MKLFPYVLIRTGGGSFDKIEPLNNGTRSAELSAKAEISAREKEKLQQQLSDELYATINSLEDPKAQNAVLNLRRDVFNGKSAKWEKAKPFLTSGIIAKLEAYQNIIASIVSLHTEQEKVFNEELLEAREYLKQLANNEEFRKGLLLSSRTLLDRVQAYREADLSSPKKKEQQTEQGLLKYITRMHSKTSPFSTFTNLTMAKLGSGNESFMHVPKGEAKVTSHIRLNNYLFQYLRGLLLKSKEVRGWFALRKNPTLKNNADHFLFLTNNQNIEAFQRTPADPLLELFTEIVPGEGEGVIYNELVKTVIEGEYIDATQEDIEQYIDQLVEFGFLEFNVGVSGIDPDWDRKLVAQLQRIAAHNVPGISELIEVLNEMRRLAEQYANAGLEERKKILDTVHSRFREVCMKIHEAAGLPADERKTKEELLADFRKKQEEEKAKKKDAPEAAEEKKEGEPKTENVEEEAFRHRASTFFHFNPEQVFYEDTTRDVTPVLDEKKLEKLVSLLDDLLQLMTLFQGFEAEKDTMSHYFISKYGKDGEIDLLTFYEDYYREYKKPEKEKQDKLKKEAAERAKQAEVKQPDDTSVPQQEKKPEESPVTAVRERMGRNKKWAEHLASLLKDENKNHSVNIKREHVLASNAAAGQETGASHSCSYGMFVQLFTEKNSEGKEELKGVLNGTFPGFGKMFSRFLHVFDDVVTGELRKWNLSVGKGLLIEDCDASYFNANLHPPLLPYEVWMPGGHNSLPASQQLPITDFTVKYNASTAQLDLVHTPTGNHAYIFDLGFQGHSGRSQLFQLLEKFSRSRYLYASPLASSLTGIDKKQKPPVTATVLPVPRVMYEDTIVLQRRGWYVPASLLPVRGPQETAPAYYHRLNAWRKEQEMPDEVFVFINPDRYNPDPSAKKQGRDDYKPQYISFNSPLLVSFFEKITGKISNSLRIEEMLPSPRSLFTMGNKRHVTEFVVQWYNYENEAMAIAKEEMAQMEK
jgi:hypothetical protein